MQEIINLQIKSNCRREYSIPGGNTYISQISIISSYILTFYMLAFVIKTSDLFIHPLEELSFHGYSGIYNRYVFLHEIH